MQHRPAVQQSFWSISPCLSPFGAGQGRQRATQKAGTAGDYRKGVEILPHLYVETDNVTQIFIQGRCYEQNH